jgi:hypothetical protein
VTFSECPAGDMRVDQCYATAEHCFTPHSVPREILHVVEALLPQLAEVYGVAHALPIATAYVAVGENKSFGFQCLHVRIDLAIIHANALGNASGGVAIEMLGKIPDNGCSQSVCIEHIQGLFDLLWRPGQRFVDAGHYMILAYFCRASSSLYFFAVLASL